MKDYLLDIVKHTYSLGFISLVKVTGTDETTTIEGLAEDRSVILQATTKTPVAILVLINRNAMVNKCLWVLHLVMQAVILRMTIALWQVRLLMKN